MNEEPVIKDFMFWGRLARIANASMMVANDKEIRRQWIDDLIPESAKTSNDGLHVEGVAHLMSHKNGVFGAYRFVVLLPWKLVRHPEKEPIIEAIELDHGHREIFLDVSASAQRPNQAPEPTPGSVTPRADQRTPK